MFRIKLFTTQGCKYTSRFFSTMEVPTMKPSDPEWGNYREVVKAGSLSTFLTSKHKEHGYLFYFWGRNEKILSLGHPKYYFKMNSFNDRPHILVSYLKSLTDQALSVTNTSKRSEVKKSVYNPTFQKQTLAEKYKHVFEGTVSNLLKELREGPRKNVPMENNFSAIIYTSLIEVLFGEKNCDQKELLEALDALHSSICLMDMQHCGAEYDQATLKEIDVKVEHSKNYLANRIEKWKKKQKTFDCYMDYLDEELAANSFGDLMTFFLATRSNVELLKYSVYHLAANQDKQKKLKEELELKLGDGEVKFNGLQGLKYLKGCVKEAMRLNPGVKTIKRQAGEKVEFDDGLVVEKGINICIPLSFTFRDPNLWDKPDEFIPERWNENPLKYPNQFIPFGFGDRMCIGKYLAENMAYFFTGSLMKNFKITLASNNARDFRFNFE